MKCVAIMTEDNKVTLPSPVIEVLELRPGDEVVFDVQGKVVNIKRGQK